MQKLLLSSFSLLVFSSASAQCSLTSKLIEGDKKVVSDRVGQYFASLQNIIDNETTYDEKDSYINGLNNYFKSDDVVIENDNDKINADKLKMIDYAQKLAALYSKQEFPTIGIDGNVVVSDLYKDSKSGNLILMATVNRKLTIKKGEKDEKGKSKDETLWIIYEASPSARNYKIKSIQLEKKKINPLEGAILVKPCSDEEVERHIEKDKPYLTFDLNPITAEVQIEGENFVPVKDEKIKTTPGDKKITVIAQGYKPQTFTVSVPDTGTITIKRRLKEITGKLTVLAAEDKYNGFKVKLDKVEIGVLPLDEYPIHLGVHKVTIVGTGCYHSPKKYSVSVTEDNIENLPPITVNHMVNAGKIEADAFCQTMKMLNPNYQCPPNPCAGK